MPKLRVQTIAKMMIAMSRAQEIANTVVMKNQCSRVSRKVFDYVG